MKLYTLFISYGDTGDYCGVYPSLEYLYEVIKEMIDGEEIPKTELPELKHIQEDLETNDEFSHTFSDCTWIHISEVSEQLVLLIKQIVNKKES